MADKKSAEEMELDREEAQLRSEAESIDPVRPEDATYNDDANPADARAAARESHPSPKGERPGSDKSPDVTGTDKPAASKDATKTDPKPGEQPQAKGDTKPGESQTPQTPFQKERARLNDSWKKLEADKEALRAERESLAAERRAASTQQQRPPSTPAAKPLIDGADAETWEAVAKDFEAEGKIALARKAAANVESLRKQEAAQAAQQAPSQQARGAQPSPEEMQTITTEWQTNLHKLAEANPELKQTGTPLRTRVAELIQKVPLLSTRGDGIVYAVEFAKAELRAGQLDTQVKSLTEKLTALEQEKKRLESLTAIPSGTASPQSRGARKFEDMSLDEQEEAIRAEADAA